MRTIIAFMVLLVSSAVVAQTTTPSIGGNSRVQTVPSGQTASPPQNSQPSPFPDPAPPQAASQPTAPAPAAPPKPRSISSRLKACLKIADGTKGRLDCDDKIFAPKPDPKAEPAKSVAECRFQKEQDQRLACYNGFATGTTKPGQEAAGSTPPASEPKPASPPKPAPPPKPLSTAEKLKACLAIEDGSKERLDCDDAVFPPKPNRKAKAAKVVAECRFQKEQDERLACYNGFADSAAKPKQEASDSPEPSSPEPGSPPPSPTPSRSAQPASPPRQAAQPRPPSSKPPQSIAKKLQACLAIEDGSLGRLNCDDAIFAPKPMPNAKPAKGVADCRFVKEQDQRLACYNGFAESIPKFSE